MDATSVHNAWRKVMKWLLRGLTKQSEVERIARRYLLTDSSGEERCGRIEHESEPLLKEEGRERHQSSSGLVRYDTGEQDAGRNRKLIQLQQEFISSVRQSKQLEPASDLLGLLVKRTSTSSLPPASASAAGRAVKFESLDLAAPRTQERLERAKQIICEVKRINSCQDLIFKMCVGALSVGHTSQHLRDLSNVKYDAQCSAHEMMLQHVWDILTGNRERAGGRISAAWNEIGFQGKDPATDFRGSGVLGLMQLHEFSTQHTLTAQTYLREPVAEIARYPFACCSIAITGTLLDWLYKGLLDKMLLSHSPSSHWTALCDLHARTWNTFHRRYLASQPKTVMDFPPVYKQVMQELEFSFRVSGDLPLDTQLAVLQEQSMVITQLETMSSAVAPNSLHQRRPRS